MDRGRGAGHKLQNRFYELEDSQRHVTSVAYPDGLNLEILKKGFYLSTCPVSNQRVHCTVYKFTGVGGCLSEGGGGR
jgi:hypothetical protein